VYVKNLMMAPYGRNMLKNIYSVYKYTTIVNRGKTYYIHYTTQYDAQVPYLRFFSELYEAEN
jgi:hypothetical protein